MQNICMKLALEIHNENSKTSKNTSELSEETKNFVDSENVSKNVSELSEENKNYTDSEDAKNFNESIDLKNYTDSEDAFKNIPELSEDLSPFVPFRQDFEVNRNNIFGFP